MSTSPIEPYPAFLNQHLELEVNGNTIHTRITTTEWLDHWRPLLAHLYNLHRAHPRRIVVALGGPPGGGKSVLAAQLSWIISKNILHGCQAAALSMDGFHYSAEYLRTHFRRLLDGTQIPLSEFKGSPDTFDIHSLRDHLQQLRTVPREMTWPGYSRLQHDVVPNFHHIPASTNIVFVDGNYILLDRGPFHGFPELFDFKVYIETPGPAVVANLIERHMAGGRSLEDAKVWVRRIDLPNARIAESTRHLAELVVERNTDEDIIALHWRHHDKPAAASAPAGVVRPAATPGNGHSPPSPSSPPSSSPAAPVVAPTASNPPTPC